MLKKRVELQEHVMCSPRAVICSWQMWSSAQRRRNPSKLPTHNTFSWLDCARLLVCCTSPFSGHFQLWGGVSYVLNFMCTPYKAPWELEVWQLFTVPGMWLTRVIFTVRSSGLCNLTSKGCNITARRQFESTFSSLITGFLHRILGAQHKERNGTKKEHPTE